MTRAMQVSQTSDTKHKKSKKSRKLEKKLKKSKSDKVKPIYNKNGTERKKRRYHPGTVALRNIKKYQKETKLLLQKSPVKRSIKKIARDVLENGNCTIYMKAGQGIRFEKRSVLIIQEALEAYLVNLLRNANHAALHVGDGSTKVNRVTVLPRDLILVNKILKNP